MKSGALLPSNLQSVIDRSHLFFNAVFVSVDLKGEKNQVILEYSTKT